MSQEARNDEKAKRLINFCYGEGVSPENIARMLNYHFEQTFQYVQQSPGKHEIKRVPDGGNYAPPVTIWRV